jgi:hypothetical protein
MKQYFLCIFLLLILTRCSKEDPAHSEFSSFVTYGNNYVMEVDRVTDFSNVRFPTDEIDENKYVAFTGDKRYYISFAVDGKTISINAGQITGLRKEASSDEVFYELNEGLFAGGRFVVRLENELLDAELTIYGSGVPIVSSERGSLHQDEGIKTFE